MHMEEFITITSKGQTTLPVAMRRKLGLNHAGGKLQARFDERKGELVITRPTTIAELSERVSRNIRPGTTPVTDVDEYYQAHRAGRA